MSTLLRVDASANPGTSISRALTEEFAAAWQAGRPVSAVLHRDLGLHPPPALDREILAALWGGPGEEAGPAARAARAASDQLVDEFLAADAFVLGVPMYNYSVPAAFKAWLDQVIRHGRSMVRGPKGAEPLIKGRRALVITTRAGDFSAGGPREGWDFVTPYLEKVLPYLGLEVDIVPVMHAPGRPGNDQRLAEARARLGAVLEKWRAAERAALAEAGAGPEAAAAAAGREAA